MHDPLRCVARLSIRFCRDAIMGPASARMIVDKANDSNRLRQPGTQLIVGRRHWMVVRCGDTLEKSAPHRRHPDADFLSDHHNHHHVRRDFLPDMAHSDHDWNRTQKVAQNCSVKMSATKFGVPSRIAPTATRKERIIP
jgi:hypothetical protein